MGNNNTKVMMIGDLKEAKEVAKETKKDVFCFSCVKACGEEIPVLYDVRTDLSSVYKNDLLSSKKPQPGELWIEIKYNFGYMAETFSNLSDKAWDERYKDFVKILHNYHVKWYNDLKPELQDGTKVSFKEYYDSQILVAEDPSCGVFQGVYGSAFDVAICLVMFGTKQQFNQFEQHLKQQYGTESFNRHFKKFYDQMKPAFNLK